MTAFEQAELYEILGNKGGRLEREGPFLLEALASAPSKVVADLACGLGLHAAYLAEHGAQVDALDISPEMIKHAKNIRSHLKIAYIVGDMCHPVGGPYGLILCLGNSLCLLDSTNKLEQFFSRSYNSLLPGGILITQTLNYDAAAIKVPRIHSETAELSEGKFIAVKRFHPHGDHTELSVTYLGVTKAGMFDTSESFTLQCWTMSELSRLAYRSGFQVEGLFGGYDYSVYQEESSDILLRLRKP